MSQTDPAIITVIDAGARYGIHPTWADFQGDLKYYAFEPETEEAQRLETLHSNKSYEVVQLALDKHQGKRDLYIPEHKGLCSFLPPDPESLFFKQYRPNTGKILNIVKINTTTIDDFAKEKQVQIDFLKIDTEGTEIDVLEGGDHQLSTHVIGLRSSINFQRCYKDQQLFPELHNHLMAKNFFLLNLDYFGQGVPRNNLFRKPDPTEPENYRYGTLVSTDGVWLRDYNWVYEKYRESMSLLSYQTLKYAYFCMLNHAPDVGIDTLLDFVKNRQGSFEREITGSKIYRAVRKECAKFLGRWRVCEDQMWEEVRAMFKDIFKIKLEGGSGYWPQIQSL